MKEAIVGVICVFDLVLITQIREEAFESLVLIRRDFERCQNPAEIRTVVSVMEEADVPTPAERVEELKQGAGTFRELETTEAFASHVARMTADHISHVKLREFVVGEVGRFVALAEEIGFDLRRVLAAANAQADEDIRALTIIQTIVEFCDDATAAKRRAKLAKGSGSFGDGYSEQGFSGFTKLGSFGDEP